MIRLLAALVLFGVSVNAQTITETFGTGANEFSIDFVEIGNPNNPPDSRTYLGSETTFTAGSVPYVYNLGKYEVSRGQIEKANAVGGLGITLADMTSFGGNGPSRPAIGITWNEAARFVNWLNTSKGYQAAYNFVGSGSNENLALWSMENSAQGGSNRFRHKDAYYFIPSTDEWYKGAYGSPNGNWYSYATGSDNEPMMVSEGTTSETAVYRQSTGPADITNAGGLSAFGTMAQGGNVNEFNESANDGVNDSPMESRDLRGGAWGVSRVYFMMASVRSEQGLDPAFEEEAFIGFRVASIPEPSSLSLLLDGGEAEEIGLGGRIKVKASYGLQVEGGRFL